MTSASLAACNQSIGAHAVASTPYGCEVHSFDPTPTARNHIAKLVAGGKLPPKMHYHELGIAHFDGDLKIYKPKKTKNDPGHQYTREATVGRCVLSKFSAAMLSWSRSGNQPAAASSFRQLPVRLPTENRKVPNDCVSRV